MFGVVDNSTFYKAIQKLRELRKILKVVADASIINYSFVFIKSEGNSKCCSGVMFQIVKINRKYRETGLDYTNIGFYRNNSHFCLSYFFPHTRPITINKRSTRRSIFYTC